MSRVTVRVFARVLAAVLQAALLLLLARSTGPSAFGVFAVGLSVGYLVGAVVGFGAATRVLRVSAEEDGAALVSALFLLRVVGASAVLVATLSVTAFVDNHPAVMASAALAASDLVGEFSQALLAGHQRFALASTLAVVVRALPLLGFVALTAVGRDGYAYLTVLFAANFVISAAYPMSKWCRPTNLREVVSASRGYWASTLVANLRQAEPMLVGAVLGTAASGAFVIAARMSNPVLIVTAAMQTVVVPEMASRDRVGVENLFRRLRLCCLAYGVCVAAASPVLAWLVMLAVGIDYADARPLITAFIAAAGLSAVSQSYQVLAIATGRPGVLAWTIGGASVLGFGAILVIATTVGFAGLWAAPLLTQVCLLGGLVIAHRRSWLLGAVDEVWPPASLLVSGRPSDVLTITAGGGHSSAQIHRPR